MTININNHFLSDDSREILSSNNSNKFFVETTLNRRFSDEVRKNGIAIISPNDLQKYLQNNVKIIGITGTNGKTTIASAMYSMLLSLGFKCALLGTRGFFVNDRQISPKGLTTPTLLELYYDIHIASLEGCKYFVMEVSSHAIVQNRIEGLDFSLKILSNITSDHLDFHKSIVEYERVKNSFFSDDTLKLINKDSPNAKYNLANSYTYGIENIGNLSPSAYSVKDCINAHIIWNDFRHKITEQSMLESNLVGKYNLYNLLASIAGVKLVESDISLESISKVLEEFGGVCGRMEVVHTKPLVVVDFAHTPDGMKNVFEAFLGRKIKVVFGAGGDRDKLKRPMMGKIAERYATKIYLTSDNPRNENAEAIIDDILGGISHKHKVIVESNRKIAIELALKELCNDEILLILGKGDESYQIIGNRTIPFDDRVEVERYYQS